MVERHLAKVNVARSNRVTRLGKLSKEIYCKTQAKPHRIDRRRAYEVSMSKQMIVIYG